MSEDPAADRPRPLGRRRNLVLMAAAGSALVLVLTLAGVAGYRFLAPHLSGEHPASLSTPDQVAGLRLSTDPVLQDAAVQMSAALTDQAGLTGVVAAFYHDPAAQERLVLLVGGTRLLRDPAGELDRALRRADETGLPLADLVTVDAGPLGGTARCATASVEGLPVSVCGWADHGSLLLTVAFHRDVAEAADLLRRIRAEILAR